MLIVLPRLQGIRANMRRTYMLEPVCNDDFFDESTKPKEFKCLLFGLAFMHALVQVGNALSSAPALLERPPLSRVPPNWA